MRASSADAAVQVSPLAVVAVDFSRALDPRSVVAGNVANVVLEVVFVYGFDWGIRGSAWGTAIAQTGMGVGIAWASILAMPYAILASSLPQRKLGIYMGLFNVFVVVPQLLVATVMGSIMKAFFPDQPIWTMLAAAIVMTAAALAMTRVRAD